MSYFGDYEAKQKRYIHFGKLGDLRTLNIHPLYPTAVLFLAVCPREKLQHEEQHMNAQNSFAANSVRDFRLLHIIAN